MTSEDVGLLTGKCLLHGHLSGCVQSVSTMLARGSCLRFTWVPEDKVSASLWWRSSSLAVLKHRYKSKVSFSSPPHLLHFKSQTCPPCSYQDYAQTWVLHCLISTPCLGFTLCVDASSTYYISSSHRTCGKCFDPVKL